MFLQETITRFTSAELVITLPHFHIDKEINLAD